MRTLLLSALLALCAATAHAQCPCMVSTIFERLVTNQAELALCTHEPPGRYGQFVRLVDSELNLGAAFTWAGQLWCGWQTSDPSGFTVLLPVSRQEYQSCQQALMHAAARQGLACTPEL